MTAHKECELMEYKTIVFSQCEYPLSDIVHGMQGNVVTQLLLSFPLAI